MEEELKCPSCKQYFMNPVLLPCYHSLCLNCALQTQLPLHPDQQQALLEQPPHRNFQHSNSNSSGPPQVSAQSENYSSRSSDVGSFSSVGTDDSSDKVSIVSETDSGVIIYNQSGDNNVPIGPNRYSSRANSYSSNSSTTNAQDVTISGTSNMHGLLFPPIQTTAFSLACPICNKIVYFDESGAYNLPKYRVLQNIVDKYIESRSLCIKCQLCEKNPKNSTIMCEQCEIFYCDECRENCHPLRGPLAKHSLIPSTQGKTQMKIKSCSNSFDYKCPDHITQSLNMFCVLCKNPVCVGCLEERKHTGHDVQPIQYMTKIQKTELSQRLHQLSEKAKSGTEFIQSLKVQMEKVSENCSEIEKEVTSRVDKIIDSIIARKQQLSIFIHKEKEYKIRSLKTQVSSHTHKLQQTTGLIQFCIEALKETDPCAYLQVGSLLLARVGNMESVWLLNESQKLPLLQNCNSSQYPQVKKPSSASGCSISPEFELTLDESCIMNAISQLNFVQLKVPGPPKVILESCYAQNNSVHIAWNPPHGSFVDGYVLELDDGNTGSFREVYCGKETFCTVNGLNFNTLYCTRVKAFNSTGDGSYSETLTLQTSEVARFCFDQSLTPQGVRFSNESFTVTSDSYEARVILGNIGFSRGIHYWEYIVEKYDGNADPSFGIARLDVGKIQMLGKDDKGWGMYIDQQRSWFLHAGIHSSRTEGGLGPGSTVGVLLDLDLHQLTFFVNEEQQGPVAFTNLSGIFYPAVSINCNVTLTLHSGLDCPTSDSEDSGV